VPRRLAAVAALALLLGGAQLHAAVAPDPLLGSWKVTAGGTGTIAIAQATSLFTVRAGAGGAKLGCFQAAAGDVVGFVELPRQTRLPAGEYAANFGGPGQGCDYSVRLTLSGNKLAGTVTYSENEEPGGPFAFARIGGSKLTSHAWRVATSARGASFFGSGRVSVDRAGKVVGSSGKLAASIGSARWEITVDPPGRLKRGRSGAFKLTLTAHISRTTCNDPVGTLVVTKGHAQLAGLCDQPSVSTSGRASLR